MTSTAHQVLQEIRLLLENLSNVTVLVSDPSNNYLNLSGHLPEDKDRLIDKISQALTLHPSHIRPHFSGTQ